MTRAPRNPRRAYDAAGREILPMTLANMRENGVTRVTASCMRTGCGHEATVDVSHLPPETFVPDVALRLRCSRCGGREIKTIPDWSTAKRLGFVQVQRR
jgi:hypothetical protein